MNKYLVLKTITRKDEIDAETEEEARKIAEEDVTWDLKNSGYKNSFIKILGIKFY